MISYIDPRGHIATPVEPYTLNHQFAVDGDGTTLGLLANGYPDSERFLDEVGRAMTQRLPALKVKTWNKGNPTIVASDAMLSEISSGCDVVIAAYGH